MEGYPVYGGGVAQATNKGKQTNLKVLCQPGTEHKEMYEYGEIQSLIDYTSDDGGETFRKAFQYPESMDSGRLQIRYAEDGGVNKDGVIELRRGVSDLSLGESNYAQVRILVDGNRYIKGMAVYGDDADFPPGVDVIFNTNKKSGVPKMDVLKPLSADPDNPFGSLMKEHGGQSSYQSKVCRLSRNSLIWLPLIERLNSTKSVLLPIQPLRNGCYNRSLMIAMQRLCI